MTNGAGQPEGKEHPPMVHTMRLSLVTRGPAPYGHATWPEAVEAILVSELVGVEDCDVLEDWV